MTDEQKPETPEELAERIRQAERAHDTVNEGLKIHSSQIEAFALAAMRAPGFVAAAGVVATLGFYSANYARLSERPATLAAFNDVLFWLFCSMLFSVVAPGLAYLSQTGYAETLSRTQLTWTWPFSERLRDAKIAKVLGDIARFACILTVMGATACLIAGGLQFLKLVAAH